MTWTNAAGEKQEFRRGVPLADLRRTLPAILDHATQKRRNVIVRPHGPHVTFIQLDDLDQTKLARVTTAVFLALETSPGNYQAWAAMPGDEDKDLARRLRKGAGADTTASGATRVAGSINFKDKYALNFPRVTIQAVQPGRTVTAPSTLIKAGLFITLCDQHRSIEAILRPVLLEKAASRRTSSSPPDW
jgi:hypothetical protein